MNSARIKVPAELFAIAESSRFEGELELESLAIGPDDYRFAQPLSWQVELTNTGSALLVAGTVHAAASCECSRCLEEVDFDFEGAIEGYYLIGAAASLSSDAEEEDEDELGEDEFEELPADHIIDLVPLITSAIMVEAPFQPLCRPDCAGLCASCGANLNEGDCGCGPDEELAAFERESNPFSALAGLSFD